MAGAWDAYIDNLIAQTKDAGGCAHCDKAAIISLDGGSMWTTGTAAHGLNISPNEGAAIARAFKTKTFDSFMTNGITVEGERYRFLREEEKKTCLAKLKGKGALTMQCTKTAVVIGHCPEGGQQGNTNKGVNVIAEYLESQNM